MELINTHSRLLCIGEWCCIHNPSYHHMRNWRQNWRADRQFMERLCPHGIGHPDPDQMSYLRRIHGDTEDVAALSVHGCDGCCRDAYKTDDER